jgi:DNA-binding transcriptional MerR regulator
VSWLKTKSAARYLDISSRTLRSFVSAGLISPAVVRGSYYFDVDSLDLFMRSHVDDDIGLDGLVDAVVEGLM